MLSLASGIKVMNDTLGVGQNKKKKGAYVEKGAFLGCHKPCIHTLVVCGPPHNSNQSAPLDWGGSADPGSSLQPEN